MLVLSMSIPCIDVVLNEKNSMARVTYDYLAENDDELNLTEGDMVKVLDQEEEGWWRGELKGKIGVFPSNFVEIVKGPLPGSAEPQYEPEPPKEPGISSRQLQCYRCTYHTNALVLYTHLCRIPLLKLH